MREEPQGQERRASLTVLQPEEVAEMPTLKKN
jgi:hypothetical protein